MCKPIGNKIRVATIDQLTIANCYYVTVTELAETRGQLTPKWL